jgi:hypothetical protein
MLLYDKILYFIDYRQNTKYVVYCIVLFLLILVQIHALHTQQK